MVLQFGQMVTTTTQLLVWMYYEYIMQVCNVLLGVIRDMLLSIRHYMSDNVACMNKFFTCCGRVFFFNIFCLNNILTNLFVLHFVTCNLCKLKYKKITEVLYDIASLVIRANDSDRFLFIFLFDLEIILCLSCVWQINVNKIKIIMLKYSYLELNNMRF